MSAPRFPAGWDAERVRRLIGYDERLSEDEQEEADMPMGAWIEGRLAAVETAVAEIQRQLARGAQVSNRVERFTGSFKDEPAFAEVVEYGRAIRASESIEAEELVEEGEDVLHRPEPS